MTRINFNDLSSFVIIASERSFTRAAARIGVTPSALSHTMRGLETRLGVQLLTRTTRAVSPTGAGERLLAVLQPRFREIEEQLAEIGRLKSKVAGSIRITSDEYATSTLLWPALRTVLRDNPELEVEVCNDYGLRNIISDQYDAGVRYGGIVARGMVSIPIEADTRMVVVAAPSYIEQHGMPHHPQDLTAHRCINFRLPSHGGLYLWDFERLGKKLRVRVGGALTLSSTADILSAARDGLGLGYLPERQAAHDFAEGRLQSMLADWLPVIPGYHLFYPEQNRMTPALDVLVEALRYRGA